MAAGIWARVTQRINQLLWKEVTSETLFLSSHTEAEKSGYFQAILKLGPLAIPLIIKEHFGNLQEMTNDWLKWADKNGY